MLRAIELEHAAARVCGQIEYNGYPFHIDQGRALYGQLAGKRDHLTQDLIELFDPWYEPKDKGDGEAYGIEARGYRLSLIHI